MYVAIIYAFSLLYRFLLDVLKKMFYNETGTGWCKKDQGAGRFTIWWEPTSWFIHDHLLPVSLHGGGDYGALWGVFYEDTNLIHEGSTHMV